MSSKVENKTEIEEEIHTTLLGRLVSGVIVFVMTMIMAVVMLFQYPIVQTFLTTEIANFLTDKTGYPITVKKVNINWFDVFELEEVSISDSNDCPIIAVDRLEIDFKIKQLFHDGEIDLDRVLLENPSFYLQNSDSVFTINKWIKSFHLQPDTVAAVEADTIITPFRFLTERVQIINGYFSFEDETKPMDTLGIFDPTHFAVYRINVDVDHLDINADTVQMHLRDLSALETHSGFEIHELHTFFRYTHTSMLFDQLDAHFANSYVSDSLALVYRHGTSDFSDFVNKVRIYGTLENTKIDLSDIDYFYPNLNLHHVFKVNGKLKGSINDFIIRELDVELENGSSFQGDLMALNVTDPNQTFIELDLDSSFLHLGDVYPFLPKGSHEMMSRIGNTQFKASFIGFLTDFSIKGDFQTALGRIFSDINYKLNDEAYEGYLKLANFKLGKLLDDRDTYGRVDLSGNINGKGFDRNTMHFLLDAQVDSIDLKGYRYKDITTNALFENQFFDGQLNINDPNLKFALKGKLNLRDSTFNFDAQIDTFDLKKTGFSEKEFLISTGIEADFKGLNPDEISGEFDVYKVNIHYDTSFLYLRYLSLITHHYPHSAYRDIRIHSNVLELNAEGNYRIRDVVEGGIRLWDEYQYSFTVNETAALAYYAEDRPSIPKASIDLSLQFKEIDKVFNLFEIPLSLRGEDQLTGSLILGDSSNLTLAYTLDSLEVVDYKLSGNHFLLEAVKVMDSVDFSSYLSFSSDNQVIAGKRTRGLSLALNAISKGYEFETKIFHGDTTDFLDLNGVVGIAEDYMSLALNKSEFELSGNRWSSFGKNEVRVYEDYWEVDSLSFIAAEQSIFIDGVVSTDTIKPLDVLIENLDLGAISSYTQTPVTGIANVDASFRSLMARITIDGDVAVDSLVFKDYYLGDFKGSTKWISDKRKIIIDAGLLRQNEKLLSLKGDVQIPAINIPSVIDLSLFLEAAPLDLMSPFTEGVLSEVEGYAIGYLSITGNPKSPKLYGDLFIDGGGVKVDMLGSKFYMSDKIQFRNKKIKLKKFDIEDVNRNKAKVNGLVNIGEEGDISFDIKVDMKEFQVMDLGEKDNDLYYGTAVTTGDARFYGDMDLINMNITAKTNKGTKLYIPFTDNSTAEIKDFIRFIDEDSDTIPVNIEEKIDLSGVRMDLNLELTPETYFEIIFDKVAGDIIKGNSKGKLNMVIDTRGDFSMFGDVEIVQGFYNFTLMNLMDKRFGIKENSHITWSGDPYQAELDMIATYTQMASLSSLAGADTIVSKASELRKRYPVEVQLILEGALMAPELSFDIDILDYPKTVTTSSGPISFESYVQGFEQDIKISEQELNKQVFSLIVLKSFSSDSYSLGADAAISSMSEMFNNQLSLLLSQMDENLEIDVDLSGLALQDMNAVNFRFSYSFMNGRLKVTRDGGVTNNESEVNASSIVGDWTVEYAITEDGKWRAKFFRKQKSNNYYNNGIETDQAVGGASVMYTRSFDSLKDLFKPIKRKKINLNFLPQLGDALKPADGSSVPSIEEEQPVGGNGIEFTPAP